MSASLSDLMSVQKNGVVAINGLNQTFAGLGASIDATLSKIYANARNILFFRDAATVSVSTLYTSPAATVSCVTDIVITNTSSNSATFYLYLVPLSGVAVGSNAIFYGATIPGNTTVQWSGNQAIGAGGTVQGSASATSVTFSVTGVLST